MPLTDTQARFLAESRVARLATADANGRPHAIPVCFAYADLSFGGERIYIVLDQKPKSAELTRLRRVRNILANPPGVPHRRPLRRRLECPRYILVSCQAQLLNGDEEEAGQAITLLRDKYPQYREMSLEGTRSSSSPRSFTAWSYTSE